MHDKSYSTIIQKTTKLLEADNPGNLEVSMLIDQIVKSSNKALAYRTPRTQMKKPSARLEPTIGATSRLINYLKSDFDRADRQVALALSDLHAKLTLEDKQDLVNRGELLARILSALRKHITDRSLDVDVFSINQRQIGNLLYPPPDDIWDELDARVNLPKTKPSSQTMLAFELVCRFRNWSLGKLVEFDATTHSFPMPKRGKSRYELVHSWLEAAFASRLDINFDAQKRVSKMKRIELTSWP